MSRKNITAVFTPRSRELNLDMYVPRPTFEEELEEAFERHSHTLLFGESGNGKTWLYKVALKKNNIPFVIANCASASLSNSLTSVICAAIVEPGTAIKQGYSEKKLAEVTAFFAKGGLEHVGNFNITQEDPLLRAFKLFAGSSDPKRNIKKIIVIDNLESIFNTPELMNELANLIILLDDDKFSIFNINFLIVGVPNGVLQYFRKTKNSDSVSNRIYEIKKVGGLDSGQVEQIIRKGFNQLNITVSANDIREISNHIWSISLGVAQRVHEYCEALAKMIKKNDWKYQSNLLVAADEKWLLQGLRESYTVVERHMNSRDTTVARRNQVIYCVAQLSGHQFDANDIDKSVTQEFPETLSKNMGIGAILAELTRGPSPLLAKNEDTGAYTIRDPRYLMCIRLMLRKNAENSKVIKKNFGVR
ncbi:AAA family ATPase [Pseudomonas sp. S5D5]|uniref:AAA family ATPase n=1 Tax=Pseudomonas sp. S5D5 TaxID=2083056 RepID=UPI000D0FFE09|nr:AAA family ATPase [Pseudomonas sp. S5D5]